MSVQDPDLASRGEERRRGPRPAPPEVSVVVPVYRSAATLRELLDRVERALADEDFEMIAVVDGSPDDSLAVLLAELVRRVPAHGDKQHFLKPLVAELSRDPIELDVASAPTRVPSSYSGLALLGVAVDFVVAFSPRPFQRLAGLGLAALACAGVGAAACAGLRADGAARERERA